MAKKLVFISHITEEKEIALAFKAIVEKAFLGMIDVFVSSDPKSLSMGTVWLNEIKDALTACDVELVFTSPTSLIRQWINFEAGAGWIRKIPVIPICHSGSTPNNCLPILNTLQGGTATSEQEMKNVFLLLAKTLGCEVPAVDFSEFIATVEAFELTSEKIVQAERKALTTETEGLQDYELATLMACGNVAVTPTEDIRVDSVRRRMQEANYAPIATTLGIAALERKGLLETHGDYADEDRYIPPLCRITKPGWAFLEENTDKIVLQYRQSPPAPPDDIPF